MNPFNFAPASTDERIVFGAQRPGYPNTRVDSSDVKEWISYMNDQGIRRIVCLLPEEQLDYYNSLPGGLLGVYSKAFGVDNLLHAPVEDFHLCSRETLKKILEFMKDADSNEEPVVVHCSGGGGRTGHVLAAWLVYARGHPEEEALSIVRDTGREPAEAIYFGNGTKEDLIRLLADCRK